MDDQPRMAFHRGRIFEIIVDAVGVEGEGRIAEEQPGIWRERPDHLTASHRAKVTLPPASIRR